MPISPPRLLTAPLIAAELSEPPHRVDHVLRTRGHIRPVAFAGNTRLFESRAVAQVRHELNAIDARRASKSEGVQ